MRRLSVVLGCGLAFVPWSVAAAAEAPQPPDRQHGTEVRSIEDYGRLPLRFERNEGQVDGRVRYLARGPGHTLFVTPREMVLTLSKRDEKASALRVKLLKARRGGEVQGVEQLPGRANYFIGNDPKKWRKDIPSFARLRCPGVYTGIDLLYHGREKEMEYDFVVAPGADPRRIRLGFEGHHGLRLDPAGNLVVALGSSEVVHRAPLIYQEVAAERRPVRGRWVLHAKDVAGFEVEAYDKRHALVIDPVLGYSTYLGGDGTDEGLGIAVDLSGSAYVTGLTSSTNFPTQDPQQGFQGGGDVFVTKLSPSGNAIAYSTYLGGGDSDNGLAIAVDGSGSAYVTGLTRSSDFPTQNQYQTDQLLTDAFVTKLSPSGSGLVYSTYLGGDGSDNGYGIAVDHLGSAYVTGLTVSTNFPTQNPYQTDQPLQDAFVTKLSPSGNGLVYSTYLGGGDTDYGDDIAVDGFGSAYITGTTASADFPTQNAYQQDQPLDDAFVTKLSPSGSAIVYSTYLGGSGLDFGRDIAVDGVGSAYIVGETFSTDFPTQDPFQTDQPFEDVFVTKLSVAGNRLEYSTYLGGNTDIDVGYGIAVDGLGAAYVTGYTASIDFPTQNPYQTAQVAWDAFVTKFAPPPPPPSMDYFTLSPCRLIDTRNPAGAHGGPALSAGAERVFTVVGQCSLPATAKAISVNIAVTEPSVTGNLRLYPAGTDSPQVSSITYAAAQTRANNAIVSLNPSGAFAVRCSQASGFVHFILDVNGYFQ